MRAPGVARTSRERASRRAGSCAQRGEQLAQVPGKRRLKSNEALVGWMREREFPRMQRLPADALRRPPRVDRIALEGMADGCEMHANLVRSSRFQVAFEQGVR